MIEQSARTQARLVDDLLDASRIAAGKLTLERVATDIHRVIDETVRGAGPSASAKRVTLHQTATQAPAIADVDSMRLRQILDNLIANAIKFTPAGGEVAVSAATEADLVRIVVRDNGRGIAPEILPLIFERGRQSSTGEQGGLGLGLAIARALVDAHCGTIVVESEGAGLGAAFIVTLPLSAKA
jgi:signal transduction histidine kinase